MANVAIDDDILAAVADIARRRNLSLERQVEEILQEAAARRSEHDDQVFEFRRIAALTPRGIPQTDSVQLLRQDRDR